MPFDYWVAAEKWYEAYAIYVMLGIFLLLFAAALSVSKRKTTWGKRFIVSCLGVSLLLGGFLWWNNERYAGYLETARLVTPGMRVMEYSFMGGYRSLSRTETDSYKRHHNPEGFAATGLYEEVEVVQPLTYLGKKGRHHYFQYRDRIFKQYETSVEFVEPAAETAMLGHRYQLKDDQYASIGFQDSPYLFYDRMLVAGPDTGQTYEPEDEFLVPTADEVFLEWVFRYN